MLSSLFPSWWSSPPATPEASKTPENNSLNPQGIKPCCACPETKSARDECFFRTDPNKAQEACADLVRKHVECMRGYGFKI